MSQGRLIYTAVVVLLAVAARPARAQSDGADLQVALDKPVNIEIDDAPITEIFSRLQEATGVKFKIDPDTLECLPYGRRTRVQVKLKNVTLRKALTPMLASQALQWEIDGRSVRIRPGEALYRMCCRATFEEWTILGKLHTVKLRPTREGGDVVAQLRAATSRPKLRLFFHVETDRQAARDRAERVLPGTGAEWLNAICHGRGWTWFVRGDDIVILKKVMQIERQLQRKVSLRYQSSPLATVLLDLARKARVKLMMDPGVMNYLPSNTRQVFTLITVDAPIAQALQVISGQTGLEFITTQEGIHVAASDGLRNEVAAAGQRFRKRPRFFVRMSLAGPGGTNIEVFMRPEELPKDVLKLIEKRKDQLIEKLMDELGASGQ